jgi:hypothetical protein
VRHHSFSIGVDGDVSVGLFGIRADSTFAVRPGSQPDTGVRRNPVAADAIGRCASHLEPRKLCNLMLAPLAEVFLNIFVLKK